MFNIYEMAKPRVFMIKPNDQGSGTDTGDDTNTTEENSAPELVNNEQATLSASVHLVSESDPGYPEGAGRKRCSASLTAGSKATINVLNALNDLGGIGTAIFNQPRTVSKNNTFRNEFRPKDGTHNLDFSSSTETQSEEII